MTFQSPERDFPAFYTRRSGSKAPYNVNSAHQAAKLIATSEQLRLNSGILIAVPIPKEYAMDGNRLFPFFLPKRDNFFVISKIFASKKNLVKKPLILHFSCANNFCDQFQNKKSIRRLKRP